MVKWLIFHSVSVCMASEGAAKSDPSVTPFLPFLSVARKSYLAYLI